MPKHQILRDNIQGLTKPAIQRLAHKAGVKAVSGLIYEETREILKVDMENIIRVAVTNMNARKAKTVSVEDIAHAIDTVDGVKVAYSNKMKKKGC